MISRRLVHCLGLSQLICWGISYYLIGGFGDLMISDLRWSRSLVYGGFSVSLVVMGLTSQLTGKLIDRHGGRPVMVAGSCLIAAGCLGIGLAHDVIVYYGAWLILGVAMRLSLYEAAFASLARIGGPEARRPISQITLLGGLASTLFWPIGSALADFLGWRGAVIAYAGIALMTIPLHLAIPDRRHDYAESLPRASARSHATAGGGHLLGALLYATSAGLATFLNSGMSAHMIGIFVGLGLATSMAVTFAALRGIGQSAARLCEILFGKRLNPLDLNVGACLALPFCFLAGLFSGVSVLAAIVFSLVYGAGNGLMTITRGTLPLVLFEPQHYGSVVGRLLAPSFLVSAAAPLAYAYVIESFGEPAALYLSFVLACGVLACAVGLRWRFGGRKLGADSRSKS